MPHHPPHHHPPHHPPHHHPPHHPPHHPEAYTPFDDGGEFGFYVGPTIEELSKVLGDEGRAHTAWQALRFAPPEMRALASLLVALYLDGGPAGAAVVA